MILRKKISLILLLTIFIISACQQPINIECLQDSDCGEGICPDGSTYKSHVCSDEKKCVEISYFQDPCQSQVTSYFIGNEITVGGEIFIIKDITQQGDLTIKRDNKEIIISGTNNPTKVNNQEILISKLNTNIDSSKRSVQLEIGNIALNENEYILEYKKEKDILGKKVTLMDVYTDKLESIQIRVSLGIESETVRINLGKTEEVLGLKITNIRPNPRAISLEKYAIVKIEE